MSLSKKVDHFLTKIAKKIVGVNTDLVTSVVANDFAVLDNRVQKEILKKFINIYYSGETDDSGIESFVHDNLPLFICTLDVKKLSDDIFIQLCERSSGKFEGSEFWSRMVKEAERRNLAIKEDMVKKKNITGLVHISNEVTKSDIIKAYREELINYGNSGQCLSLLIKYEHYFEDKEFVKKMLQITSNLIPFFARNWLKNSEFLAEIISDLRDGKINIVDAQLNRLYNYIDDIDFLEKIIGDSPDNTSHDRAISIIKKGHPRIKENKKFIKELISKTNVDFLEKERFVDMMQESSYDLQNDKDFVKYFYQESKKAILWEGNIEDLKTRKDYLDFSIHFRGNFVFVPREYKEDIDFVKEVSESVDVWSFLPPKFKHDKEIIRMSFGCRDSAIKFLGFSNVLEAAQESKVIENDETFFLILDEYSNHNPVHVLFYKTLIKNETFYKLLKESVDNSNYELDLSNIESIVKEMQIKYQESLMYNAIERSDRESIHLRPKVKF